jgi:hypothetical protein
MQQPLVSGTSFRLLIDKVVTIRDEIPPRIDHWMSYTGLMFFRASPSFREFLMLTRFDIMCLWLTLAYVISGQSGQTIGEVR